MWENINSILQFSALVFFNLFCILGIFAVVVIIFSVNSVKNKTEEALDSLKETASSFGQIGIGISDIFAAFPFKRKKLGVLDILTTLFRK
jgi:hypothetical protein